MPIYCLVVAAVITCSNKPATKPAPAAAVQTLQAAPMLSRFIPPAPPREAWRQMAAYSAAVEASRAAGRMPAPTPAAPLSTPWSVTTRDIPGLGTFVWFNGRLQQ